MEFPRVTQILRYFTSYEHVPAATLERAASRGTSVHAICAGLAKGAWISDDMIKEELLGYIQSFRLWKNSQVKEFIVVEKRYTDKDMEYSGQVDFVIKGVDEQLYLVDLKTSAKPQKTYPIQMAAYDLLLNLHDIKVIGAMLVYLNKNGEFPDIHLLDDMTEEISVFKSALECYKYFNKRKYGKQKKSVSKNSRSNVRS